jgi:dihydrodipicolinate synthase/N-acetylneuraminate lyase
MPTPGQMAAGQQSTIPRELLEQMPQQRGALMGAGHAMTVMAARLAELSAEVRELRQMLAPPSAVILTGAEVAEHFRRLREGGA